MEFQCPHLCGALEGPGIVISAWDAAKVARLSPQQHAEMAGVLQEWGTSSAVAQGLASIVTDLPRLCANPHGLYIAAERRGDGG